MIDEEHDEAGFLNMPPAVGAQPHVSASTANPVQSLCRATL